jgi:hypothetical protein
MWCIDFLALVYAVRAAQVFRIICYVLSSLYNYTYVEACWFRFYIFFSLVLFSCFTALAQKLKLFFIGIINFADQNLILIEKSILLFTMYPHTTPPIYTKLCI